MAEGFRIAAAYVQVSPDTEGFKEELEEKLEQAVAGVHGDVKVGLDTSELDAQVAEVKSKIAELDSLHAEPSIGLDKADFDAGIDEAKVKLDDLDSKTATPKLTLDKADFDAEMDEADQRLDDNDARTATPALGLDKADFDAEMDEAEARLDEFEARSASARLGATGGGDGGGGGGGGFSIPGGMWTGIGTTLAGLLPGIGGAATGLGALAGTAGLAFGGISKTLSAAYQSSQNVGLTQAQLASTAYDNSVAVRQSQESLQQAFMQSAQASTASAQQIEQSQLNLGTVERTAAQSQIQAVQGVVQAQQQLEQANFGLSAAQYNLSQAWIQARNNLVQLEDQERNSSTTIAAAKLAIQQAAYQQRLTDQNAYSTSLDRQQAALAVIQAQEQLTSAQHQATYVQAEYNLQESRGVAGSQQVLQAKQAVTSATYAQTDAQKQVGLAQLNLTNTQLNNAAQIKQAQLGLVEAQEQAAWSQANNALAVKEAQQNLTSTIRSQQLQWASTASTANAAANQFAKFFARLSPAGKSFVDQVLSMRGAFHRLINDAQTATLPGFTQFLTGISKLMPHIERGVTKMGGAISNAFGQFGKQMQTPAFAKVFDGLINNGVQFVNIVLPAFAQFIQMLAQVGSQKGAVLGLANLLGGIGNGLTNLTKGLSPFTGALSSVFSTIGTALADLGGPLGTVIGALAQGLAPILKALLPGFKTLADALGKGLAIVLKALGPVLAPVATAITDIVIALAPLLPSFAKLFAKLAQEMVPLFIAMVPIIKQIADLLAENLQASMMQLLGAAIILVPPITKLIISLTPLINLALDIVKALDPVLNFLSSLLVDAIATAIGAVVGFLATWQSEFKLAEKVALWLWHHVLDPLWQDIVSSLKWVYQVGFLGWWHGVQWVFGQIEAAALWVWHHVFDPLWQGIVSGASGFVAGFKRVWNTLQDVFKTPVNFLINTVYDNGIAKLWNDVVGAVGLGSLKLPHIQGLAGGGVVAGYKPGHDTVPALLSPGEGVLTPQATQAIGPQTVHALNKQYPATSSNPASQSSSSSASQSSSSSASQGASTLGALAVKLPVKEAVKQGIRRGGERPAEGAATSGARELFADGGIAGGITGAIAGAISGAVDVGKMVAAVATGNTAAFVNAAAKLIGTHAAGDLGKIMIGLPKTLVADLAKQLAGAGGGGGGGAYSKVPAQSGPAAAAQKFAAAHLAQFGWGPDQMPPLIALWNEESGWNADAVNASSGAYGIPQALGKGHPYDLGDYANQVIWGLSYIKDRYHSPAAAYAFENSHVPHWYDDGGWLMPGDMPVNKLRKPEAVLTPDESQAFLQIVRHLTAQGGPGVAVGGKQAVFNFYGTQLPNAEQQAEMDRRLAMTLSGV